MSKTHFMPFVPLATKYFGCIEGGTPEHDSQTNKRSNLF